jgi:PadR family transcriptional regulator, regulatory protein AphA
MIRYILLGFLNYQPMTGYDLKQSIDHSTAHFWHAHHSQIYTTLRQMEQDGLVSSQFFYEEGQPNRRVYTISDAGKADLKSWLDQPMLETSAIKEDFLVRIFFSGQREPEKIRTELNLQLELHQHLLETYHAIVDIDENEKLFPHLKRDAAFWRATLNMGMQYEEMYIRWLKDTLHMVDTLG